MRTHQDAAGPDPFANDYMALIHAHESPAYVLEGCSVTDGGSNDLTVDIASGTVVSQGTKYSISSTTVTLASANSFKRYDLIVVDNTGTVTDRTGASEKKAPDMSQGDVLLAIVEVPANASGVSNSNINDARILTEGDARSTGSTVLEADADDTGAGTLDLAVAGTTYLQVTNGGNLNDQAGNTLYDNAANRVGTDRVDATSIDMTALDGSGLSVANGNSPLDVGAGAGISVSSTAVAVDTAASLTITGAWTFENQADSASVEALALGGNRATVADNDEAFLSLQLSDGGGTQTEFARLTWVATDVTDASEDGRIELSTIVDGTADTTQLTVDNANLNLAQDQTIQASGTSAITFDSSGNVTHPQATTLTGDVTLQQPDDDYQITGRSRSLSIENTVSGNGGFLDVGTADTDGSDGVGVRLFGVGRSGATNAEFFSLSAETDGTNITHYRVGSSNAGSGSHHPIKIEIGGNTDQFVVQVSDGIAAKFPNTATGTGLLVETNDGSSQEIKRDSSTLRHKHNVQTLDEVDPEAVLGIDPIRYTETPDGDAFKISFGAEHFESIGLGEGLAYDGEGRVAGFLAGSRVIDAAQQVVLQDHEDRLSSLEDQVQEMAA